MTRAFALLVAAALAACGGPESDPPPIFQPCDFIADPGICVVKGDVPEGPARDEITPERITKIALALADHYHLDVYRLHGWTIAFRAGEVFDCGGVPAGGCAEHGPRLITVAVPLPDRACIVWYVPIAHEMLHALTADYSHDGPTWPFLNDVRAEIAAVDPACTNP